MALARSRLLHWHLWCDRCGVRVELRAGVVAEEFRWLRVEAGRIGWVAEAGGDRCPECRNGALSADSLP